MRPLLLALLLPVSSVISSCVGTLPVNARPVGLPQLPEFQEGYPPPSYRNADLSDRDLRPSLDELLLAVFNSRTRWPEPAYLPDGFDPTLVMEFGKDPGLGIRALHEAGTTGKGVGIAIIDTPLLPTHEEYADRLVLYERPPDTLPDMHGTAVASLAVGRTVGTAPGADLYFVAANNYIVDGTGVRHGTYEPITAAVLRILDLSNSLPEESKIRVLSMSLGIDPQWADTSSVNRAIELAKAHGIFVIYSNMEDSYGFGFHGLGRPPMEDPNLLASYIPAHISLSDYNGFFDESVPRILAPMDSRAIADYTDPDGYTFNPLGGRSWTMPYLAGVYALAVQVDPTITGERFWALALETGTTVTVRTGDGTTTLGPIVDPPALMAALR